ncbi:MAG: pyruvate, phosphate dikinase [Desulfobacteraceae bacterium]|nr:MAG: pyruvate, phosphate dikinase [Desulfobacteraceae bacterium]
MTKADLLKKPSKALEANIADYHVEARIDPKYFLIQDIMSKYYGLMEGLNTFLKELSHPYRNWQFIVREARNYSLNYFHLMKKHPEGPAAATLYVEIFLTAIKSAAKPAIKADAADNFLLFIQKMIKDAKTELHRFKPVLDEAFLQIHDLEDECFFLFVKSYYRIKRIAEDLINADPAVSSGYQAINHLLVKYFQYTYAYWLSEIDPMEWFQKEVEETEFPQDLKEIFKDISTASIDTLVNKLKTIIQNAPPDSIEMLTRLLELRGYGQFVETYRKIPQNLFQAGDDESRGWRWKLFFLFHIMNTSGLLLIHEEALREINRSLSFLIANEEPSRIQVLIEKTFSILKVRAEDFPATALNCVLNMGEGVYKTDDNDFVNFFTDFIIDLGFQAPMIQGVGNDWQIKVNSDHIQNIRTWLKLIERKPQWSVRLLSALIIHLSISGVFIKDTDLFPRDITKFLNSDIEPVYNLCKQLARLFPAFFNDIGAEGELRDISTRLDEICHRKDVLIHFLRKQGHVESSNRIIGFIEATLLYWQTKNKEFLEPYIPPSMYEAMEPNGPYIDGVNKVMSFLNQKGISKPDAFLSVRLDELKKQLETIPDTSPIDRERVELALTFYKLTNQKYNLNFIEIDHYISQLSTEALPDMHRLKNALQEPDLKRKIQKLLDYLGLLKAVILSNREYEIREDIYQKRHITVDIPSMYGSYHEMKFDALGLTFRIESLVNVLFEELVDSIDLTLITKASFFQIYDRLELFDQALEIDGLSTVEFKRQMDFLSHALQTRGFSYTQYLDIFKGFALAVRNIINDHFNNIHGRNLNKILSQMPRDRILPKYLPKEQMDDDENMAHRISEIFFREKIALALGLTQLDLLLTRTINILFQQAERLPKEKLLLLLNYDPHRAMTSIDETPKGSHSIINLGNKGLNLLKLRSYGWPIPPGFIITTEVFRCQKVIESYRPAGDNFRQQVLSQVIGLEKTSGKSFGTPENPLLLSVRSGSAISQPGMMDTLLNVGINEKIANGIAEKTGNAWFAWDNYRRFLQCYGMAFGVKRDDFDTIIGDFKQKLDTPYKSGLTGKQMKKVALAYKSLILDSGITIIENPFEQLLACIQNVFQSWESNKAKAYRKIMGISDDWGTAVIVQAMVFGNISDMSGTGVLFTHSPRMSSDSLRLWGDFTVENQGEDVVSGLVKTLPISKVQQTIEQRETDITLETHFPEIYNTLKEYVFQLIYDKGWSPQEMEFTFEGPSRGDLFLLQTRDMAMREMKKKMIFDLEDLNSREIFLGHGIGVSGGAMSGRIVFTLDEIKKWRKEEPERLLILIRGDTVPDDILEIHASDGLLTARGGLTSHAAVVAHRLEKTCVVGCGNLICDEKRKTAVFKNTCLQSGNFISIDGQEGSVFNGLIRVKQK